MNDESEIERLRKTNDALHRRIQKIEGLISKGYHGTALDVLCEQRIRTEVAFRISEHQEVKKWMHIASKHGEKNAKLQSENARLRDELELCKQLLRAAKCPNCSGSGMILHKYGYNEYEQEQCSWCFERSLVLAGPEKESEAGDDQ